MGLAAADLGSESAASALGDQSVEVAPAASEIAARRRLVGGVALVVVVVDQLTKLWAQRTLDEPIDGPFGSSLRLVENTGSAFSLGEGYGPLFGVLAIMVAVAMFWVVRSVRTPIVIIGLGLVQGGAIGNVLDRAFRDGDGFLGGAVIDFLEVGDWWPVFNVADVAIVVGGIIVALFGSRE